MFKKIAARWNSLPSWLKATVKTSAVLFVGAASGIIHHTYLAQNGCLTEHCIREYAISGAHGGFLAAGAYLLKSPLGQKIAADLPEAPK